MAEFYTVEITSDPEDAWIEVETMPTGTPITTVEELQAMVMSGTVSYYLANDIDASDTINWNGGAGFAPKSGGTGAIIHVDGRNHKITYLYINRPSTNHNGIFTTSTREASILLENIILENVTVMGRSYIGGLVGRASSKFVINNCGVSGNIVSSYGDYNGVGGLVGYNAGAINRCYSKANVWNSSWTTSHGSLVGENYVGGTITDCYATGSVATYYESKVDLGGLVGVNHGTINRCYSTGLVLPTGYSRIHGFAGLNAIGSILASYWDVETSQHTIGSFPSTDPPTGKTTAQMKQQATYAGWDFDRTWKIIEGASYPMLRIGATKARATKSA